MVDNSGGIAPFCDATGQFMPLLCTMNCTLAPEEVRCCQHPPRTTALTSHAGSLCFQPHTWAHHDCLETQGVLKKPWSATGDGCEGMLQVQKSFKMVYEAITKQACCRSESPSTWTMKPLQG